MSDAINPDHYKQLPTEAIEIIEAAIDKAPSNQDAYLHGQVLKYILRCWNKNGIEDLEKAKWYLDRLIESFEANEPKQPSIKQSLPTEPPDGWRWIEVGETLRKGDTTNTIEEIPEVCIGTKCVVKHFAFRRNRFEIGEKVVLKDSDAVWEVEKIIKGRLYKIKTLPAKYGTFAIGNNLAPYIEDAT